LQRARRSERLRKEEQHHLAAPPVVRQLEGAPRAVRRREVRSHVAAVQHLVTRLLYQLPAAGAGAGASFVSIDSATSSAMSFTFIVSSRPVSAMPSFIIVWQNGQATAMVPCPFPAYWPTCPGFLR